MQAGGGIALVVIDMLNAYKHADGERLAEHVVAIVDPLKGLIERAGADDDVELLYVNDNYGDFTATRDDLLRRARDGLHPELIEPILPPEGVDFLQKVRHSAFYSTALEYVLRRREVSTVVLTGQVTEQCILYSALDAYVRHFEIRVARDAVASIDDYLGNAALKMMQRNMRVELLTADEALTPPARPADAADAAGVADARPQRR